MKTLELIGKRPLILRDYQIPASEYAMTHDIAVLGLCPNAGKTEISIHAIMQYLLFHPGKKVLVLPHSTKVLMDNYIDRLNAISLPFTYSTNFNDDVDVYICLPNSEKRIKGDFGYCVIDEGHENYKEERVQRIVKNIPKQTILTGSPSKFIKAGNYNIFVIAINDLPSEYFAKLGIELVASNYDWNCELEVKTGFNYTETATEKTLENIVLKLVDRIKYQFKAHEFNNPNFITTVKTWVIAYKKIGKTLFVCKSIKHASMINDILKKHGVNSTVSDSSTDKDSLNIQKFKNNEYDVLVVVDRARLGYSDVDLYNVIDMSGTLNPDIIHQMFCRVLRGDQSMQKFYIKVTSQKIGMMDVTHACVGAALMLTDKEYLSTFNGSNFNDIMIPTLKSLLNNSGNINNSNNGNNSDHILLPVFTHNVIDMFKNIIHNLDNPVSIYKLTSIGDVKYQLGLLKKHNWTDLELEAEAKKYTTRLMFQINSRNAYNAAKNKGIDFLNKICAHMIVLKKKWTDFELETEAKKYNTRRSFKLGSPNAYRKSLHKGPDFMNKICAHMKPARIMVLTDDMIINAAKKCNTKSEFEKTNKGCYSAARLRGKEFFDRACSHMTALKKNWTDLELELEAKSHKNRRAFQNANSSAYQAACRKGPEFMNRICAHMIIKKVHTDDDIRATALKCNTRKEFYTKFKGVYKAALKRGSIFMNDIFSHIKE